MSEPKPIPPVFVPSLSEFLLLGVGGSGLLWVLGFVFRFIAGVLLTRLLGITEYALYALAFVYVEALGIVASLGLHALSARYLPGYRASSDTAAIRGLVRFALTCTTVSAPLFTALGAIAVLWLLDERVALREPLLLCVLLVTAPGALLRLRQGTLQGLSLVVQAQVAENLVRPMVSCLLFGSLFVLWDGSFLATHAIWFSGAALLCSVFIADLLARKALRPFASAIPRYNTSRWFASVIPLFSISVLTLVNTRIDLFVLSFLANTEAVGLFSVVGRVMVLMSFVMGVFTATFAPRIGTFNEARDRLGLQRQLTVLSRTALAVSAPIAVALLIFGTQVLGLFGKAFEAGELALQILIAGQLVNVVCGAVGMVLNMTGHEHIALRGMILTGLLNLTLDLLLIPEFGINGAAAATTASLIAANVALWWVVRKRMGLDASVIGLTQGVP